MTEFVPFPKIPRLRRDVIVTEKIDGTNACIVVTDLSGDLAAEGETPTYWVQAQSRKRFVTPEDDNFGFAAWVREHQEILSRTLGEGHHFGEWWGSGIQRGYGLDHKRFSLFNTSRWAGYFDGNTDVPPELGVVPVLGIGPQEETIERALNDLREHGSYATKFDKPEGVVVYHTAARSNFKVLLEGDELPKGVTTAAEREPRVA